MIVAAFVGYYPDMEHLFSVGTNHGICLQDLHNMREDCELTGYPSVPGHYGFVDFSDGKYSVVDRKQAYDIAKACGQLKSGCAGNGSGSLDSYQIDNYDWDHMFHLKAIEADVYIKLQKPGETT